MKVVILAAGRGKRFRALHLPKPLTCLSNGQSILQTQLHTISKFLSLDDVLIVVGYHKEKIMEQFPDLLYVYSPNFAQENTSKSLLRALRKIDDDVLWMNGDVVFHPSVLEAIINFRKTSMIVNVAQVGDEEVRYRTDANGKILEVSKTVSQPQGEALGINFFSRQDLPILKQNLDKCADNDYFERGIELSIADGVDVWSIPVKFHLCAEVDFPEDLEKANKILHVEKQK